MKISYKKLWMQLVEKEMTKQELRRRCGFSSGSMAKLTKGQPVSVESLLKICECLDCNIGDICDAVKTTSTRDEGDKAT